MTPEKKDNAHSNKVVRVSAPARLHLGFLDLSGQAGRKFGSIGLAIDNYHTIIEVKPATTITIENTTSSPQMSTKVTSLIDSFYATLGQHIPIEQRGIQLSIIENIPEHAGLGSGTQLALTIGTALCQLHQITASTADIATQLGRGTRSGIGIATFDSGGFIVDGGLDKQSIIPPVLASYDFPEDWCVVLVNDPNCQGVHGEQELAAFKKLPPFPLASSQAICHLTLMKLLPALIEQNIISFGQAITDIQTLIGDHFAPMQGGRYASKYVETVLNYAKSLGHAGIAQSSWGPTGCIFVESKQSAQQLIQELNGYTHNNFQQHTDELSFTTVQADSNGATIKVVSI